MATRYPYYGRDYERGRSRLRYGEEHEPRHYGGRSREDRGVIERASDEVRSWFGDEEAERRRRIDEQSYWRARTRFGDVRARDVMTRNVITLHPSDTVQRAARLMRECDCGAIPVVDDDDRLIGLVTDRDITVRLVARGADIRRAFVDDCMTDETFACHVDDPIEECMRTMSRHQIRRLPIVDDRDRVIGIVSQSDLARHAGTHAGRGERRALADTLCAVSEPTHVPYR